MLLSITRPKLVRLCSLFLPLLLWWSGFQSAHAQPPPTHAVNLSTRMLVRRDDEVAIAGFIIDGPPSSLKHVFIRASGEAVLPFITDYLHDPTLLLMGPPGFTQVFSNDCLPSVSNDACIDRMLAPGHYTATVRGEFNGTGVGLVEVYDLDPAPDSKLGNISTRAPVSTGDTIVIAGLILSGSGDDNIIVRGIGPSMDNFFTNFLADPTLELRDSNGTLLASNNDWEVGQPGPIMMANLAPTKPKEAALAATLPPGQYTALLAGLNNTTGIGLVEIYDLGP